MLYTELTKKAMRIAFEVHKDQVDKNGIPYIYHPIHLAEQMSTEYEICVALAQILAPILSFTTEEVWKYLPKEDKEISDKFLKETILERVKREITVCELELLC